MVAYSVFCKLLSRATECVDFDQYVAECSGSVPLDDADDVLRLMRATWAMGHEGLTIRKIAETCDRSMRSIAMDYGLPYRTVQNWAGGVNRPPECQLPLIAYAVLSDYLADV